MRAYLLVVAALAAVVVLLALGTEAVGPTWLEDPAPWLQAGGAPAALLGLGLLVADLALPVPSSLVMIAFGAHFGVVAGTLLALLGGLGAAVVGFGIGRAGGPLLARLVPTGQRTRADRLLARWGGLAILVTRPVPVLAETTAIVAGASPLGWGRLVLASLLGNLPAALLYASAGAAGARPEHNFLLLGLALVVAAGFWLVGRRLEA